ncbi:VWA domain-containing protein [Humisphaera borealis]|uniref:VWA domain-containing protein n=1 Tax=Humisphaera borealis TaxID=2807512 RepID=A0A7M2WR03_9BACT|nr:VWA domain-containing protein [Humisphaera borealis]QOV87853.1 VWA domain-containing protein [Humisphaera borealis]
MIAIPFGRALVRRAGVFVVIATVSMFVAVDTVRAQSPAAHQADAIAILLTANTEGHVKPCESCPMHVGDGGLDRRATIVAQLRTGERPALLLDAGAWLAGPESAASAGAVMVAAYNAMGYDAAHITPADLGWGKSAALTTLRSARFSLISATLLSADGKPMFEPFVVKKVGAVRFGVIGVSEAPKGLDFSPALREQFEGVRFAPPAEAIATWLPKAAAESDRIIILYDGTAWGLATVRKAVGNRDVLIAVAGIRPERLPEDARTTVLATEEHGKSIGVASLADGKWTLSQSRVPGSTASDAAMRDLLATYAPKALTPPTTQVAVATTPTTRPDPNVPPAVVPPPAMSPPPTTAPVVMPPVNPPVVPATQPAVAVVPPPPATMPAPPAVTVTAQPRVTAKQPLQPRGLAGVGLTQEQVDAAVKRGADFLWPHMLKECGNPPFIAGEGGGYEGYHTLASLALVRAGLHKRDAEFNRMLRVYLDRVQPETIGTYAAGVLCMLIEAYGDPRYEPKLRASARYLFEGLSSKGWDYRPKVADAAMLDPRTQKPLQVWGGRPPIGSGAEAAEKWNRATTQKSDELDHDNSLVQFAVLGLHAAARAGVEVPIDVWRQVVAMMRTRQTDTGGWGYVGSTSATSGSMTCAAAYALTVARYHLQEKSPAEDESIERGLAWLAKGFAVDKNPGAGEANLYYYLYSVERLGRTLDTEFIGPNEWYPMGAKYLLDVQKENGSWHDEKAENQAELSTSFAILFLSRGTPKLAVTPEPKVGPGVLKTGLLQPPAPRLYIILDCSGSMMEEMGGKTKFDVARQSVASLLAELPDATQVALRVYGHRKTALDPGANDDTELLVPIGPLDRQAMADQLKKLRARGKTPMARSLQAAKGDIDGMSDKQVEVLLLTDGGEDSQPRQDPVAAAEAIGKSGKAMVHVVGFDIGREDWGRQLRGMADKGRGKYWGAFDTATLLTELRAAVLRSPGAYEIHDASDRVVHRGQFGDSQPLEPGRYAFVTAFGGKRFNEPFWVNAGEPTAVLFDAGKFGVTEPKGPPPPAGLPATRPATPDPVVTTPPFNPATPPANRPKFCVHCGNKLGPTGNFCTSCGKKIGP